MQKYFRSFILIGTLFFTTGLCALPLADEDAGLEDNMSFYLYDDIDLISTLKFEYGKPRIVIKAVFPQLASDTDRKEVTAFNDLSLNMVKEEIQRYRDQVKNLPIPKKQANHDKISNHFYIDYNSAYLHAKKENILSVRLTCQAYMGTDNHIVTKHRSLNYNLSTMQEINLADLFSLSTPYLNVLAQYSRNFLYKTLKQKDLIDAGTMPYPDHYNIWNLTLDGLLLTFEEGQVTDSRFGMQTVLVPYHIIANLLSEDIGLTQCLKNNTRCFRSHLVTGGFIDEA